MVRSRKIGLHENEMDMLHDWRIFMEDFTEDTFRVYQDWNENEHVVGFPIYYGDIKNNPRLHTSLLNWTEKCLELGNRVLFEHFQKFGVHLRPVLRIVHEDPSDRTYSPLESLRMRDRGRIISTTIRVKKAKEYMGWLKVATYYCLECGTEQEIPQRLGRNRKRPYHCTPCLEELMGRDPPPEIGEIIRFNPIFEFNIEKCNYEDIQYLEVQSIEQDDCQLTAFVRDELVGEFKEGDMLDVLVLVRLDHIANRDFEEDTRRVLLLEILSAERI
jgi:DNA replicative helicase MCM subunit Mcm2 (Cdc46/Mcm family)